MTFSNNLGQIDRDRFADNPDGCWRIVHAGSSHAVALQVPIFEKFNTVMESELAVALGRCVEVVSLGMNNGDPGANFPRVAALGVPLDPDLVLLEIGSFLMLQLEPELYRRLHGYDPQHRHLFALVRDVDGRLVEQASADDAPLHTRPPLHEPLSPMVPFFDTLRVDLERVHPRGRYAFDQLALIVRHYEAAFPRHTFVLHTGLDQAQCHQSCRASLELEGGERVPVGAQVYVENMRRFCDAQRLVCLHPDFPSDLNREPESSFTYVTDGHFNTRGHQWLARELTRLILGSGLVEKVGVSR